MPDARTQAEIDAELAAIDDAVRGTPTTDINNETDNNPDNTEVEAEAEASRKGWVPKDKFKGPAEKWKPASQFLADGERFQRSTERELNELRKKVADFEGTQKQFSKFYEELLANKQKELDDTIAELRVKRSQAVREGDDDLAVQLEDRIDLLREQKQEVKNIPETPKPAVDENNNITGDNPILNDWIEDGNQWFRDDAKLRAYAVQLGGEMRASGSTLQGRAFLSEVTKRMREEFPRQFKVNENPHGGRTESSAGGGGGNGGSKYSERDLPPEDLALMKTFIKQGFTTREKFLKDYFNDAPRKHRSS